MFSFMSDQHLAWAVAGFPQSQAPLTLL